MLKPHSTKLKNIPASVRRRLRNLAEETKRPTEELYHYFGMERFLYRVGESKYADRFFLKGGLILRTWDIHAHRPTRDIDLLSAPPIAVDELNQTVSEICTISVIDDGLQFNPSFQRARIMKSGAIRVSMRALLERSRINLQLDVGCQDQIYPAPTPVTYPTLLDFPPPNLSDIHRKVSLQKSSKPW